MMVARAGDDEHLGKMDRGCHGCRGLSLSISTLGPTELTELQRGKYLRDNQKR
jgi:hypothetical protein